MVKNTWSIYEDGATKRAEQQWNLPRCYYGTREHSYGLSETSFALGIINQDRERVLQSFREFMKRENADKCLEDEVKHRKTDTEIKTEIEKLMNGKPIGRLQCMERARRNEILRKIKKVDCVSLRQISRVTGLSVDIVFNT